MNAFFARPFQLRTESNSTHNHSPPRRAYPVDCPPSRRSSAFGVGPRFASLIASRAEYCHASRVHCTVTSSGLASLLRVAGQERRTGHLPLDESRDRPVVVRHALKVDGQPDEAITGEVPGVPLDTLVAVRDAQNATGWVAKVPSAVSEGVSEEALPQAFGILAWPEEGC